MRTCPSSSVHIPKSRGGWSEGSSTQGIGVKWLKTQPLVY
ncbi:transposase, partial [Sulfolobus sp. E5]